MDENFVERMRFVRERLGVSGRKLSLELGLNANAWASYESGGTLPGSAVLHSLCMRGVNLNWLMTGDGEPWWKADGSNVSTFIQKHDSLLNRHLGLGRLSLIASRSTTAQRTDILKALLASSPEALSLGEISTSVAQPEDAVAVILMELMDEGVVEELSSGEHTTYRAHSENCWSTPTSKSDMAQIALNSVETLLKDVYPAAVNDPSSAVLVQGTLYLKDAKGFLKGFIDQVRAKSEERLDGGMESVTLVLGATVKRS